MVKGVGIGFRREIADEIIGMVNPSPNFIELAPENWIDMGGYWRAKLDEAAEKYPISLHGLSLSIGSPDELDFDFLKKIKAFIKQYDIKIYSEHLSYSKCDNAHLYDLLPIPFTQDAVIHIAERIKVVQDYLEMPLAIENVSYYTAVAAEMKEHEFISEIVNKSNCNLLLDVNNVYVNAFNHGYNTKDFINNLPLEKVSYIHMAGHEKVADDLIIDTHGEAIIDPVYELLKWVYPKLNNSPVLLERDFNFPEINELKRELTQLHKITNQEEVDA